jgi:hypothetical protein
MPRFKPRLHPRIVFRQFAQLEQFADEIGACTPSFLSMTRPSFRQDSAHFIHRTLAHQHGVRFA